MLETVISWGITIIVLELVVLTILYVIRLTKQSATQPDWRPAIAAPMPSHRPTVAQVQQNYQRPAPQQPAARPAPPPVQQTVVNVAPVPSAAPQPQPDLLDRPSLADNYYAVLDVAHDADEATIKQAYRQLMRQWHPDTCKVAGADDEVRAINEAYEVLSDDDERQRYDAGLWLEDEVK